VVAAFVQLMMRIIWIIYS